VSAYASYTLAWCFPDRATANTDATLKRLEAREDYAIVPWVWQVEVGNALGKAVTRAKVPLARALDIWAELQLLPIRPMAIATFRSFWGWPLNIICPCTIPAICRPRLPPVSRWRRTTRNCRTQQKPTMW